jgi:hypothetical protein
MACINVEIRSPLALVQIGIAAPALVTSYLSGAALNKSPEHDKPTTGFVVRSASASG